MKSEQIMKRAEYLGNTINELKQRIIAGENKESTVQMLITLSMQFTALSGQYMEAKKEEQSH